MGVRHHHRADPRGMVGPMSRVYEYWCDNVRQRWSSAPCPRCEGARQEQKHDADGRKLYWFTSECELICIRCHEERDSELAAMEDLEAP